MARTEEAKVKIKVSEWIKSNMPKAYVYKPPGGAFGQNGTGDYIIVYNATPIMIEVKKPDGGHVTDLQMLRLKQFSEAGGLSAVLHGFDVTKLIMIKQIADKRFEKFSAP